MRAIIVYAAIAAAALPGVAAAQSHEDHAAHSQYAAIQGREIKALDSATVANYLSGAGMGFALSAELNGYPGPRHVLELADQLTLSAEQRAAVQQVFDAMQKNAMEVGEQIVALERELDRRFAHRHIDAATIEDLTARIGALNGRARSIHLAAHLETTALLNDAQVANYNRLRGYTAAAAGAAGHTRH